MRFINPYEFPNTIAELAENCRYLADGLSDGENDITISKGTFADIDFSGQATPVAIIDNNSAALDIKEGSNSYLKFNTTNGSEATVVSQDFYTAVWSDYSSSTTVLGFSSTTIKQVRYKRIGRLVILCFDVQGTSNATFASISLPYTAKATGMEIYNALGLAENNGSYTWGECYISTGDYTVLQTTQQNSSWANIGEKRITGQIWYETSG